MNFFSYQFLFFLALLTLFIFFSQSFVSVKFRSRTIQLMFLAASVFFYAFADIRFLPVLFYVAVLTWISGFFAKKKRVYIVFVILVLLPLLFFKYTNFVLSLFSTRHISLILPLGISFFTFQSISYIIDCHKEKCEVEKNFITMSLFVSFFPVISSGPIQRPSNLIPQLKNPPAFDYSTATDGLKLFVFGIIKKLVAADSLAVYVNHVYSSSDLSGISYATATFFYAFQLYFDFSSYSDMAIGIGKFFGFDSGRNFDHPYLAKSVSDFWRRWHMSLSSWLRDYVYISCGGNRVSKPRQYINLLITFLVSGIWHGAAMTFIVWGLLHGIFQCVSKATKNLKIKNNLPGFIKIIITFCLICLGWVFFRAENLEQAFMIIKEIFKIPMSLFRFITDTTSTDSLELRIRALFCITGEIGGFKGFLKCIFVIFMFGGLELMTVKKSGIEIFNRIPGFLRYFIISVFLIYLSYMLAENTSNQFLYFDF